jgi:hypothetical protein
LKYAATEYVLVAAFDWASIGSIQQLAGRLQREGVTPDAHTLYTELLEWRAAHQELSQLVNLLV